MTATVRFFLNIPNYLFDLVNGISFWRSPSYTLCTIDRTKVSILICPLIPDSDSVLLEVCDVGVPLDEPEQFMDDGAEVALLRGEQGEVSLRS